MSIVYRGGAKVFLECVSLWGKAGVNIFCLIMGYYGISSNFRIKKVVKLEAQVLFYSILGLGIAILCRFNLSFGETVISIFPFVFGQYWYISAYFMVYILSPFINKMVLGLSQSEYQKLVGISMIFWCIIPFFTLREDSGLFWNQFIWFIVMYVVGGYLRIYKTNFSKKYYWLVLCGSNIILIMSVVIINISSCYIPQMRDYTTYFRWSNSPIIMIMCIAIMRLAERGNIGNNKWINSLARGTLGVYLFHENVFIQKILWNNVFNNSKYFYSYGIVLHFIIAILLVFLAGNSIEIIRKILFEKMDGIFSSFAYKIENIIERVWENE